jgi:hypothetical protein
MMQSIIAKYDAVNYRQIWCRELPLDMMLYITAKYDTVHYR